MEANYPASKGKRWRRDTDAEGYKRSSGQVSHEWRFENVKSDSLRG